MPSNLPSSFASAAAGNNSELALRRTSSRWDSSASADWSRRPNGATQTFRRPPVSANPQSQPSHREQIIASQGHNIAASAGTYVPPPISASRHSSSVNTRYTRDYLLSLFQEQQETGDLDEDLADLYVGEVDTNDNADAANKKWGRRDDGSTESTIGPDVCLNRLSTTEPLMLFEMTDEEKELFMSSVNSPLKAPNPTSGKEGLARDPGSNRKTSFSQNYAGGLASPTAARPPPRRREQSESFTFARDSVTSPSANTKSFRDDPASMPPAALLRRRTDHKETDSASRTANSDQKQASNEISSAPRRQSSGPLSPNVHGSELSWAQLPGPFAGLGQPVTNHPVGQPKRPSSGLQRAESRFRGLMGRETSGSTSATRLKEQGSLGSPGNTQDIETDQQNFGNDEESIDRATHGAYDSSTREQIAVGSAALGGANDDSPSDAQFLSGLGASHSQPYARSSAFSFPVNADNSVHRDRRSYSSLLANPQLSEEPSSPTLTNPYQSPERGLPSLNEEDGRVTEANQFHLPGLGDFGGEGGPELPRTSTNTRMPNAHEPVSSGRARASQRGMPQRFPSLSGLGGPSGPGNTGGQWSAGFGLGTPSHERHLDNLFESSRHNADDRNADLSGLGSFPPHGSTLGASSTGDPTSTTRSSKLGSLFPSGMHDQMRGADQNNFTGSNAEPRKSSLTAEEGSDPLRLLHRGSTFPNNIGSAGDDISLQGNRGQFSDFSQRHERGDFISTPPSQFQSMGSQPAWAPQPPPPPQFQQSSALTGSSSQLPAAQQKQMVMPDRIRWIYRDPQGNTQGPWSGLEMHDWYKAGFFSPELLVKKAEDAEYEPLAQLIRRIGNSREPFLVPQIGIPAPESSHRGANWPTQNTQSTSASINPPAAQPPFANSFPSFGTTLTAEQQNALERRKQEEQFLMARQKEHLAQQQVMAKQMQMQGSHGPLAQPLQHHSSAQSLHSQPSYSSITSPGGFPSSLSGQIQPNQYEAAFRSGPNFGPGPSAPGLEGLANIQEQEPSQLMQRLSIGHGSSVPFSSGPWQQGSDNSMDSQRAAGALAERANLQAQQVEADHQQDLSGEHVDDQRLKQFHQLRGERSKEDMTEMMGRYAAETQAQESESFGQRNEQDMQTRLREQQTEESASKSSFEPMQPQQQTLSLTEQVQKTASVKQSPISANDSSFISKIEKPLAESHPPSQPSSPLPAPAARRGPTRSVAEALAAESASQSASPVADTPAASLAPWAKESTDSQKQPSLKKIQEAEARRVARQEEASAAARRAAAEKEMAFQPAPPVPALPSSSTWASSDTGASPTTQSPWAKGSGNKSQGSNNSTRKTLQQIQKEEEALARKQKAVNSVGSNVAAGSAHSLAGQPSPGGKRYADLVGMTTANPSSTSSTWTTVGSGGKPKTPTTSSAPTAAPKQLTAPPPGMPVVSKPKSSVQAGKIVAAANASNPVEEFKKWAASQLRGDLSKGIEVDDFVNALYSLPTDNNLITEAVHSSSSTMDSRHFAEEFVRRRALADRGKSQPVNAGAPSSTPNENKNGGGWNEVLRRPPVTTAKDDSQDFKVVPTKKKGGKK
ncbi:MAG: hypothetical protein M1831_004454 [Alyxoria varia]|nr:MAG: hypothetical protein M1831_004454 [Alyxoria varia]